MDDGAFGEVGLDDVGVDGADLNAFGGEFGAEGLAEAGDGEFAGGVGGVVGHREFSGNGADVDDGAGFLGEEVGENGVDGVDVAPEVGVDDFVPVFEGEFFGGAGAVDAGVVDEYVELTELGDRTFY